MSADPAEIAYGTALEELDGILAELDAGDVDIDRLAERVRRAAQLILICRERIGGARLQIETAITDLEAVAPVEDEA